MILVPKKVTVSKSIIPRKISIALSLTLSTMLSHFQLSSDLSVHGETKEEKKINDKQTVYVLNANPSCNKRNQYEESKCSPNCPFLPLLALRDLIHSLLRSLIQDFQHFISPYGVLAFLNFRGLERKTQAEHLFPVNLLHRLSALSQTFQRSQQP